VVVLAGRARAGDRPAIALAEALGELGVETVYLGREEDPQRIAAVVAGERADALELCLARGAGVLLLRQLLKEMIATGQRDVSIVVHRVE
jgi:methylmalonyl-CoA mutase cobalamin-binding subunit